jgi:hypothetical protein
MRAPRHGIWYVAGACATALVLLALFLFVFRPAAVGPPAPVTLWSIHWSIQQLAPENGTPEFAERWINQSGPYYGFPFQVRAGGTFNDSLVLVNDWLTSESICSATAAPPLQIVTSFPTLPMVAKASEDNLLTLTIEVTAAAGSFVNATGVVSGTAGC